MQGAHLVEPLGIVPLHLVEVDGTGARKSPGLQAIEVFAADPVGGTRYDKRTGQTVMAECELQGDLATVAIADNQRIAKLQFLNKPGNIVGHAAVAQLPRWVGRPSVPATVGSNGVVPLSNYGYEVLTRRRM